MEKSAISRVKKDEKTDIKEAHIERIEIEKEENEGNYMIQPKKTPLQKEQPLRALPKKELRGQMLEKRETLSKKETEKWDEGILERLLSLSELSGKKTDTIYCYISVRGEAGTQDMIRHFLNEGFRVAVPRVRGREMDFYYIKSFDDLEPGKFGIPEPRRACLLAENKAAPVIVPGVAFSERFERTGYGAGYYDRFFEKEPGHRKIAVCYDFQLVSAICSEPHDIMMDYCITPTRTLVREETLC